MRKRIVRIWDVPAGGLLPALITVASAFCIGGLAGMLLAAQVGGGGHDSLAAYIEGYLAAAKSGSVVLSPGLLSVLWESVRWPLFAFLMGFTALGVLGIPTLLQVRGNLRAGPCPGRRACFPLGGLIGSAALCVPAQLRSARCWNTGRSRHCCARWPDSFDFGAVRRV